MTLFNLRTSDEACVQAWYLENVSHEKGHPIGSKQKEHWDSSKEGKKKWKEKYKKTIAIATISIFMVTSKISVGSYIHS